MKAFITGITGQLGFDVNEVFSKHGIECRGVGSKDLNICDKSAVHKAISEYKPDIVIHCAAYTKVDLAEDDPIACWNVNVDGTRNIAEACRENDCAVVYISSDYVFPGTGSEAYETEDPVNPLNVYGMSKLAGELAVQSICKKFYIVRGSWLIGRNGSNFVKTMLKLSENHSELRVVADQIGSPTFTEDLAKTIYELIGTGKYGIYHVTNEGYCSWAELAEKIFTLAEKNVKVVPVSTEQYDAKANRPKNSRLSKQKIYDVGIEKLPKWDEALDRYLYEIGAKDYNGDLPCHR